MSTGLSVVIPAYNEESNVATCLTRVHSVLKELKLDWEIILVNDGSKDRTGTIARHMTKKIPNLTVVENKPNQGYGGALSTGFSRSTKEFIAFVPADNQFDFSEISKLLDLQRSSSADIVSGIRRNGGKDPIYRKFLRWGWNTLVRGLFGYLASDIDCGFKLLRREILEKVKLTSNGAMIDTQLFAGARARGLTVAEVEVTHLPRTSGRSTGGDPKVAIKAARELLIYWWQLRQEILVEQGRAVFRWEAIIIITILFLGSFTRLYKIDQYMTFLGDEGRDVYVVRQMLLGQKIALIGPGTSIGNMYLGPLYYYLMLLPLFLSNFSPVGPAIQIALFGVATIALLWWVGRQWFGRASALAISLLYSLSPTVITYSHSSWNPNIMPLFSLLSLYGIWKVWRLGYWRWLIGVGICFAFVLNSHYLGLLLGPVIFIFWLLAKKKTSWIRYTLISAVAFSILMSPLLIFDLRHNWVNFNAISEFFSNRQTTVNLKIYKSAPNLFPIWENISASLLSAKNEQLGNITAIVLAIFTPLLLIVKRKSKQFPDLIFTLVWILTGLIGLGLYKQHIYDHYFAFLWPAMFLLLGFVLDYLISIKYIKYLVIFIICLLVWTNLAASPLRSSPNFQMTRTREVADFIKNDSEGKPFNLALLSKSNYDAGYRYYFALNNAPYFTAHQQVTERLYVICENPDQVVSCQPINNPLWEIASFGWAKIDREWEFPWGVKLLRLVHNPTGEKPIP